LTRGFIRGLTRGFTRGLTLGFTRGLTRGFTRGFTRGYSRRRIRLTNFSSQCIGNVAITKSCHSLTGTSWNRLKLNSLITLQTIFAIIIRRTATLTFTEGILFVTFVKETIALEHQFAFRRLDAKIQTGICSTSTSRYGFRGVALETSQSSCTFPVILALPLTFSEKTLECGGFSYIHQGWNNVCRVVAVIHHPTKGTITTRNLLKKRAMETFEPIHAIFINLTSRFTACDIDSTVRKSVDSVRFFDVGKTHSIIIQISIVAIIHSFETSAGATGNRLELKSTKARQTIDAIIVRLTVTLAFTKGILLVKESIANEHQLTCRRRVTIVITINSTSRTSRCGFIVFSQETTQSPHTIPVTLALSLAFGE
jgi:hypothetical protein